MGGTFGPILLIGGLFLLLGVVLAVWPDPDPYPVFAAARKRKKAPAGPAPATADAALRQAD